MSFSQTDVSIPGNNSLSVQVGREFKVENLRGEHKLPGFSDWQIDIPRVYGDFRDDTGWVTTSSSPTARCSIPAKPDAALVYEGVTLNGTINDIWHGYYLHVPGKGDQELLVDDQSKLPSMQDGVVRPWITAQGWRLGCLSTTANGYGGEGFLAVSPEGEKYYLNYAVSVPIKPYSVSFSGGQRTGVGRVQVSLLVTRVEDRLGNYVNYGYASGRLTSIQSSDGRSVVLSYNTNGNISRVQADGRVWAYAYEHTTAYPDVNGTYRLKSVTLPDGTQWTYTIASGDLMPIRDTSDEGGAGYCKREPDEMFGAFTFQVGHPSGAVGVFQFGYGRQHMNHAPIPACQDGHSVAVPSPWVPGYLDGYGLDKKTVTGPGISQQVWSYLIDEPVPRQYYSSGSATDPCPTCTPSKQVKVTAPDGSYTQYEYGFMYGLNDGRLLGVTQHSASGETLSSEVNTYVADDEVASQPFPAVMGSTLLSIPNPLANTVRPQRSRAKTQDGVTFTWHADSFDAWGRALTQSTSSTLGYSRTDTTVYYDDLTRWVLGQMASITNNATGLMVSATDFDGSTALPLHSYEFGMLKQTLSYNGDGTVASVKDGNDHVATLSSWKRGIPQSIGFADGSGISAAVDDRGWISSVSDETGAKTCYGYDAMGRINQITYPAEGSLGTCDTSSWNATTQVFEPVSTAEVGLAAGHWRQTVATGNARKVTYYDAFWRPMVTREYDASNEASTAHFQRFAYDHEGRTTFASYPGTMDNLSAGTWTSYDTLGRVTSVALDTELNPGLQVTTTAYLTGFRSQVTDPRGGVTTTSYMAYDKPTADWPVKIEAPEGAVTEISRDLFGKPTAITRHNTGNTVNTTRSYSYDGYQRLCRSVEPETGATLTGYDAVGNVLWSASGLTSSQACDNGTNSTVVARKVTRTYDARNRLTALSFPDGLGNQSWSYYPDGKPHQVTTYNANSADAVINTYSYNARRLLTGEGMTQAGMTGALSVGYGYDANGNLAVHTYPSGLSVTYAPNALGQPTQAGSSATGVSYYPNGAIKQFTYGNGVVHAMAQNARQLPARSTDTGAGSVIDMAYTFDANGNVGAVTDYVDGRQTRSMTYDGLDRLRTAQSVMFGGDNQAVFTYDVLDNLMTFKVGSVSDYAYVYNVNRQLETVTNVSSGAAVIGLGYDVQGNLSNKNGQNFTFDYGNRLRTIPGKESYRYDANGRRVLSTAVSGQIVSLYGQDGVLRYQKSQRTGKNIDYIYLGGSLVARAINVQAVGVPLATVPASNDTGTYTVSWTGVTDATSYTLQEKVGGAGAWTQVYNGTAISYVGTGKGNNTYSYRVQACIYGNCSSWSNEAIVAVTLTPTSVPGLSAPTSSATGSFTVSWTNVINATSYRLEQQSSGGSWSEIYSGADRSKAVSGLSTGTYGYRARACSSTACGDYSAIFNVQVILPPTAAPMLSSPGTSTTGSYTLGWSVVSAATSYELQSSGNGLYSGGNTSYAVSGQGNGTVTYRVRACNEGGCGPWSVEGSVTTSLPPSSAPTVTAPSSSTSGAYTLSWSTVGTATSYEVQENGTTIYSGGATSTALSGKTNGTHAYTARACNSSGCGPWSASVSTTVALLSAPAVPTGMTFKYKRTGSKTEGYDYYYTITWNSASTATYYELQGNIILKTPTNVGNVTTITDNTSIGPGAMQIRACNAAGCSAWSANLTAVCSNCTSMLFEPARRQILVAQK